MGHTFHNSEVGMHIIRLNFISQHLNLGPSVPQRVQSSYPLIPTIRGPSPCTLIIIRRLPWLFLGTLLADWVHFCMPRNPRCRSPIESGLCLADQRRLKISDIIALSRSRGGLAFLSACQTAIGDEGLSDEAIHISAGVLFAGYGGVVGMMWSIDQSAMPVSLRRLVARDVYKQLFGNGTRPDCREAARALHGAVGRLRGSGRASFVKWLPLIHVG